jgi:sporulation protein YlmC with PRC-barrel domain
MGSSSVGSIRRLNDDAVERQFTAKDLIGKEVYDSSGKRIGEVKDVVLASSTNPQLSRAISQGTGMASADSSTSRESSGTTRTASGSVGGVGASGSVTTGEGRVGASGTLGGTSSAGATSGSEMARQAQSMMGAMSENAVIVSYGGFLGAGSSLLRVPVSQLNYDNTNRRITVNVAETELSSLPEATETSRSAAE